MTLKCVHQSCGKIYIDVNEPCYYHPGPPIFHEGLKGWKCCKRRVLTFDEFMSIAPCTTGTHSTTDHTPAIEKKQSKHEENCTSAAKISTTTRPRAPVPSAPQSITVLPPQASPESEDDDPSANIPPNKICRRRACGKQYTGERKEDENCIFHPGVPVFHEGSKGYTCCKRRVLEFDQFLNLQGCQAKKQHLFIGSGKVKGTNSNGEEAVESVRHDFYQTSGAVIASFFLKKIEKTKSHVKFNSNELFLDLITTDSTPKRYIATIPLFGTINPTESTFKVMGTKLEVNFIKADHLSWPVLRSDDRLVGEVIQIGKAGRA
ncbi:BgTH12-05661 [Blumeria graminis f. sp. triticale]|uniref:BgTH12-05661 n=1 Tax=Blumeria graminis f. sp. triticale TaxID=1689686 RepID=A0A9W4GGJ2_BLUGR|nr:BgTH12-05661 [Blumeria graminis f. sp. triticale]